MAFIRHTPYLWGLALLLWLARPLEATAGLPFLNLSSGARSLSLAEAVTALPGGEAISYNPAALQARGGRDLTFAHGEWIQGIRHEYLSLSWGGERGTWGLAGHLSQTDNLEHRTGPTVASLGKFSVYEGALNLAYARRWNERLRLGANLKLVRQSIFTEAASGGAVDLGLLYALAPHLHLGLALRNLGRMNNLAREATPLPRTVSAGLAWTAVERLLLVAAVQQVRGGSTTARLGGEYTVRPAFLLRGGYQNADTRTLSLGVGLVHRAWSLDYAFIPFADGLGEAHRVSLHLYRGG